MPQSPLAPCRLETLERRQLLAAVDITRFGGIPDDNRDDTAALMAAIRATAPGDTVNIPAGTFQISNTIELPTGRSLQGVKGSSKLDFVVGRRAFAIEIDANSANVVIDGLTIRSNDGVIGMHHGRTFRNIRITNNDFQWGYDGSYYNRLAVQATVRSDGLIIENNFFHDSPTSDRNVDLWYMSDASYSYNKFYMVNDGGHILESGDNVRISFNVGRKIHRMGVEIQGMAATTNMTVEGNVFYDWYRPWNDTFGLSVMPMAGRNVKIVNNYLSADFDGEWGESMPGTGGPRFGIGIEAGFTSGVVGGNTVIGPWATGVAAAMRNTPITSNDFYGTSLWGWLMGEPGYAGMGSYISLNNRFHSLAEAPPPPEVVGGGTGNWPGGGGTGMPDPDPTPGGPSPILSSFVIDGTQILLSWTDSFRDETGYIVERSRDGKDFQQVWDSHAANVTTYTDKGLPNGTQFWYRVSAYKTGTDGVYGVASNIVAPKTKGIPPSPGNHGGTSGFTRSLQGHTVGSQDPLDNLFGNNPIT